MADERGEDIDRIIDTVELHGALFSNQQGVYKYTDKDGKAAPRNDAGKYTHQKSAGELAQQKGRPSFEGNMQLHEGKAHAHLKIPGYLEGIALGGGINPAFPSKRRVEYEQELGRQIRCGEPNVFFELNANIDLLNLTSGIQASVQNTQTITVDKTIGELTKDSDLVQSVLGALGHYDITQNLNDYRIIDFDLTTGPSVGIEFQGNPRSIATLLQREYNLGNTSVRIASPKSEIVKGSLDHKVFTLTFTAGFRIADSKQPHTAKSGKKGVLETKMLHGGPFSLKIDTVRETINNSEHLTSSLSNQQEHTMKSSPSEKKPANSPLGDFNELLSSCTLNSNLKDLFSDSIKGKDSMEAMSLVRQCQTHLSNNAKSLVNIEGQVNLNGKMITKLFDRIDSLENKLFRSKNSAEMMAHYQGLIHCCDSMKNFGSLMNSDLLFFGGLAGSAFVQSLASVSKFTGIAAEGAVGFLDFANFGAGILTVGLNIVSSIIGRKKSKKAAKQEAEWRKAVMDGFKTLHDNLTQLHADTLKCHGIQLDYQEMYYYLTREQLNDMSHDIQLLLNNDQKIMQQLNQLQAGQQEILLKFDKQRMKKLMGRVDGVMKGESKIPTWKILRGIKNELEFSVCAEACAKAPTDHQFAYPSWFYLQTMSSIQKSYSLLELGAITKNVPNLNWWYTVVNMYCNVLPKLPSSSCDIKAYTSEINDLISDQTSAMLSYLDVIGTAEFQASFFGIYSDKLRSIKQKADRHINTLKTHYSHASRKSLVESIIRQNNTLNDKQIVGVNDSVCKSVCQDEDAISLVQNIQALEGKYNQTVWELHDLFTILFGGFLEENHLKMIQSILPVPIPEGTYSNYSWEDDKTPNGPCFKYLKGTYVSLFSFIGAIMDLSEELGATARKQIESIRHYMTSANVNARIISYCVTKEPSNDNNIESDEFDHPVPTSTDRFFTTSHNGDTNMLNQTEIDDLNELLEPLFSEVEKAKDKSVIYVLGCTGDGKSTLINYLTGSEYRISFNEETEEREVSWVKSPEPLCKVDGGGDSVTSYPQIITRKRPHTNQQDELCDMPGFSENRGEWHDFSSAIAPHVLSRYVKNIKLMWVINHNHFDTGRYMQIKKMLRYFLLIGENDIEKIVGSLCIAITRKKTDDPFTKIGLGRAFDKMINSSHFTENEKQLLILLKERIIDESIPMCVAKIDDQGISAQKIIGMVNTLQRKSPDQFDFSSYCPDLTSFRDKMRKVMLFKQHHANQIGKNADDLGSLNVLLQSLTNDIETINSDIVDEENIEQGIQATLVRARESRVVALERIETLMSKNDLKMLPSEHNKVVEIAAQLEAPRHEVLYNPPLDAAHQWAWVGPKSVGPQQLMDLIDLKSKREKQGYTCVLEPRPKKGHLFKRLKSERQVRDPKPGISLVPITKSLGIPCKIEPLYNPSGKYELTSETKSLETGYHATLRYPIGEGCKVTVIFSAPERYHPENQRALSELEQSLGQVNQNIATQEVLLKHAQDSLSEMRKDLKAHLDRQEKLEEKRDSARSEQQQASLVLQKHRVLFERCESLIRKLGFDELLDGIFFAENTHPENETKPNQPDAKSDMRKPVQSNKKNLPKHKKPSMAQPNKSPGAASAQNSSRFFKQENAHSQGNDAYSDNSNSSSSSELETVFISEDNMINWDWLSLVLRDSINQFPQHRLSETNLMIGGDGVGNESVRSRILNEIPNIAEGGRLFIPVHINGNHFTLLTVTRQNGQLSALYCDSNYHNTQNNGLRLVRDFCLTDLEINHFEMMNRSLQTMFAHEGVITSSNDCAIYVWYFCETLCRNSYHTADELDRQI